MPVQAAPAATQSAPAKRLCRWGGKEEPKIYTGAIGVVQVQADTYSRRLKCTSITLIAIGAVGMLSAIGHAIGSRHAAERMIAQPPHGEHGTHQ
jgi:hypothetical protein